MDLKKYKMCRSKNFPLPQHSASKYSIDSESLISTTAIISNPPSASYNIHYDQSSGDVIMFNEHQYLRRRFNHVIMAGDQKQNEEKDKKAAMVEEVIPIIEERISGSDRNMIILPVLDAEIMNEMIFPKAGYTQSEDPLATVPETPNCIIKTIISNMLNSKKSNTIISLSILGIRPNGSLTDELDYEWLEETEDISKIIKQKMPLKVTKEKKQVKTFDLNRQQITSWNQAKQILFHYHQLSEYVAYWRNYEDTCNDCNKIGELYEISEVEVDPEYGSIISCSKKCYVLRINQYLKNSNLVNMRISQSLSEVVNHTKSKNTRDYPLMLFLNQGFDPAKKYQFTLLSQLGIHETLKEESVGLCINLQVPGTYIYLKNYKDNKKISEEVKALNNHQQSLQTKSQKVNINDKSLKLLQESQKVTIKSYYYETSSSHRKRKPPLERMSVKTVLAKDQEDDDDYSPGLEDVYGSKRVMQKLRGMHSRPG